MRAALRAEGVLVFAPPRRVADVRGALRGIDSPALGEARVLAMKLMLTNDDGIDAPGLQALLKAALTVGDPVIVAPATHQSGCSHMVTWERAVRVDARDARSFAVHGTPADCTRLGLLRLVPDARWVLSGVNHGGNLGADVHYSGTVAAVREAVLHGWPGIAFSHYHRSGMAFDWDRAAGWVAELLGDLMARPIEPGTFFNVNLPHLTADEHDPEIVFCSLDPNPLPLSYRHEEEAGHFYDGDYQARKRTRGSDVDVCFNGSVSVTPVRLF